MNKNNPLNRHQILWFGARLWLALLVLFSAGRVFYLTDYKSVLNSYPWEASDLVLTFLSSLRFDFSVATALNLPVLMLSFLPLLLLRTGFIRYFLRFYSYLVLSLSLLVIVSDHYYYLYFKDHFNNFFWEFWENTNNAGLVIGGLGDEVPLRSVGVVLLLGLTLVFGLHKVLPGSVFSVPGWYRRVLSRGWAGKVFLGLSWLVLAFLFFRSTFDRRPLSIQDRRLAISDHAFLNLLHTNPYYPIFRGYQDWREARYLGTPKINYESLDADFDMVALANGSEHIRKTSVDGGLKHSVVHSVAPDRLILKKKPRHVVLFFMESYSGWVQNFHDKEFRQTLAGEFLELKKQGYYFSRHFSPGAGTLKNITQTVLGFPQPREFPTSINYVREGHKKFSGSLARIMERFEFRSKFFYAGHQSWHRLYQFIPAMGFSDFYAEHSYPDQDHHAWGLYDEGLYNELTKEMDLNHEKASFNFVMNQSNHPPYLVPDSFKGTDTTVPQELRQRMTTDEEHLYKRVNAYRYSDYALGEFFRQVRSKEWFKDTLFVITADHPFGGAFSYPQSEGWIEEQIPLLFYAPDLMNEEYIGAEKDTYTTHLDLMPSILSLAVDVPVKVETFGRNILNPDSGYPEATGVNFYFSCLEGFCLKKNRLYELDHQLIFQELDQSTPATVEKTAGVRGLEQSYYNAALHYLYSYEDS